MSTGFRVASPGLSTTGAEPGQLDLVRVSSNSYTWFASVSSLFFEDTETRRKQKF